MPDEKRLHSDPAPSSAPALVHCGQFRPRASDGDKDAGLGNLIHRDIPACMLGGPRPEDKALDDGQRERDESGASKILELLGKHSGAPVDKSLIKIEERLELLDDADKVRSWGYLDILYQAIIVDIKGCLDWAIDEGEFRPQLAFYALMLMRKLKVKRVMCIVWYATLERAEEFWMEYDEATAIVELVFARKADTSLWPTPNPYCAKFGGCTRLLSCPAVNQRRDFVIKSYPRELIDDAKDPEKITDPVHMSQVRAFADILIKQGERMKDAALGLAKTGVSLPYWKMRTKAGRATITDVEKAMQLSGIPQPEFLRACSVSLTKLADIHKRKTPGLKAKDARNELEGMLFEVLESGAPSSYLEQTGAMGEF